MAIKRNTWFESLSISRTAVCVGWYRSCFEIQIMTESQHLDLRPRVRNQASLFVADDGQV
jgi:hypothetical protein